MAYEILHGRHGAIKAGGTLTQFTFAVVEKKAGALAAVAAATAGTRLLGGIVQNKPASGDPVEFSGPGSVSKLKINSTVTMGNLLITDATGLGVTTSATGSHYVALALADGVLGDIIEVLQGYYGAT